jgi:hypothetical protein
MVSSVVSYAVLSCVKDRTCVIILRGASNNLWLESQARIDREGGRVLCREGLRKL